MSKIRPLKYWDSAEDFWNYTDTPHKPNPLPLREGIPSSIATDKSEGHGKEWSGTNTFEEAQKLSRYGDKEGLKKLMPVLAQIKTKVKHFVKELQPVYGVTGEFSDVAAFLSGEPEHMISFQLEESNKRIIKILFNGGASANVDKAQIERRGAMILALIDVLESTGIRTEVFYYTGIKEMNKEFEFLTRVKRAEEPLNIDRLAFIFTNAAMLRRISFKAWELDDKLSQVLHPGYGRCINPLDEHAKQYDIIIERMYGSEIEYHSIEGTIAKTLELLKAQGTNIEQGTK